MAFLNENSHRGFKLDVEMVEGSFVAAYFDPMVHKPDQWCKIPESKAESMEHALQRARAFIDRKLIMETNKTMKDLEGYIRRGNK